MSSVFAIEQPDYESNTKLIVVESREKAESLLPYFERHPNREHTSFDLQVCEYSVITDTSWAEEDLRLFRVIAYSHGYGERVFEADSYFDYECALVHGKLNTIDDHDARNIETYVFAHNEDEALRSAEDLGLFTRMDEIKAALPSVIEIVRDAYTRHSIYSMDELNTVIGSCTHYVPYLTFHEKVLQKVGYIGSGGWGALEWVGDGVQR